jgi:hypothetical protein
MREQNSSGAKSYNFQIHSIQKYNEHCLAKRSLGYEGRTECKERAKSARVGMEDLRKSLFGIFPLLNVAKCNTSCELAHQGCALR